MAIAVQTIIDRLQSALDADGQGDYYLFDQDYKPAINYAIDYMVGVINTRLEGEKGSLESLRELIKTRVYQSSNYSRVSFDSSDDVWSVLAVYINPTVARDNGVALPNPATTPAASYLIDGASHLSAEDSAKRLTLEEWNETKGNPFVSGNNIITTSPFKQYAYLSFNDYSSTYQYDSVSEIEVRPTINGELVSISFLRYPTLVSLVTDNVEFPQSMTNLITTLALRWIAYKQGDNTNIYSVSDRDIQTLFNTAL
jgi:hypothetical protein